MLNPPIIKDQQRAVQNTLALTFVAHTDRDEFPYYNRPANRVADVWHQTFTERLLLYELCMRPFCIKLSGGKRSLRTQERISTFFLPTHLLRENTFWPFWFFGVTRHHKHEKRLLTHSCLTLFPIMLNIYIYIVFMFFVLFSVMLNDVDSWIL